jgi:uracil-DNA glycosylase family 4
MKDYLKYKNELLGCSICRQYNPPLIHNKAFPLFMNQPSKNYDILFVVEAPNITDTVDEQKGYLTVDPDTDPSGKLFYDLFINELQFSLENLFITNSVLCLPEYRKGKYSVTAKLRSNCKNNLIRLIEEFAPIIVCPLGTVALAATKSIDNHNYNRMKDAVAQKTIWFNRILFPLYHTSVLARNKRNGRPEDLQREDWRKLNKLYEKLKAT